MASQGHLHFFGRQGRPGIRRDGSEPCCSVGPRLGAEESLLSFREGRHHFARSVCGMKDERCGLLPAVPKEAGLCFVEGRRGAGTREKDVPGRSRGPALGIEMCPARGCFVEARCPGGSSGREDGGKPLCKSRHALSEDWQRVSP